VVSCVRQSEIVPAAIRETIVDIASVTDVDASSIKIVPCRAVDNALAFSPGPGAALPQGEYIFYNPEWVRNVLASDRTRAVAFFGHEFGHLAKGHFGANRELATKEKETEADEFAGCAVAQLGGDWSILEDLLSGIRFEIEDTDYPSLSTSLEIARAGFERCGGTVTPRKVTSRYLIFFDWDSSTVSSQAVNTIRQAIKAYQSQGATLIAIRGFTDTSGRTLERLERARRQVSALRDVFIREGIPEGSVAILAQDPRMAPLLVKTDLGVREPQNRRVEIELY